MIRAVYVLVAFAAVAGNISAAELRIGLSADVTTMDPHLVPAQPNITAQKHVFDTLVQLDEKGRTVPGLASWSTLDPLTWEFTLRKGVKFHDGSELTTADVAFSLERPYTITGPGGFVTYVKRIVAKEIVDSRTIRLKTQAPYGALAQDLSDFLIVSKRAAAGAASRDFDSGKAAVGTGPYRLVRFARGDRIELARHDAYWGGRGPWDKVTLRIMPTDPVRTASLLSGEIDAIEHVPSADLARLKRSPAFHVEQAVSWRTIFLHLDQYRDRPPGVASKSGKLLAANPFKDIRVRRALSHAINRRAIAERVMEGLAVPAANIVSPSAFGHDPAVKPDAYDPAVAKQLLAEAGYSDGFSLVLAAPNNRYINDEQVAQAVAQMFARIGINARVDAMPLSTHFPKGQNGDFGMALLGWGSLAADLALRTLTGSPNPDKGFGAWNWSGYANPQLDSLIERSLKTVEPAQREAAARAASAYAARELALIPLHYQIVTWAMQRSLSYAARMDEYTLAHHFRPAADKRDRRQSAAGIEQQASAYDLR